MKKHGNELSNRSQKEFINNDELRSILSNNIDKLGPKWDVHLPVFLTAPSLARILWCDNVYRKSLDVPGVFVEFGSQWGASLNLFMLLKLIYEPWNVSRKIVSFTLFDGFPSVDQNDGGLVVGGDYSTISNWSEELTKILEVHADKSPLGAKNNYEIVIGDASKTFAKWLDINPHTVISHAHFDMDIYKPTKDVLEMVLDRMPKGGILIFDELNCPAFPGETIAVQEVLGIRNIALKKTTFQPYACYCIV